METIIIAFVVSFIAGLCADYYLKSREDKIRKQIDELNGHEEYLEKLAKGNVKLIRVSLALLFSCIFLLLLSLIMIVVSNLLSLPETAKNILYGISLCALSIAAGLSFHHAVSIIQSHDMKRTKVKLQAKREKLERKIR